MLTAKEIRETFKRYFEEHGHHIVPSAPMVIKDDPTLMFTNAGMNQFKTYSLSLRGKRVTIDHPWVMGIVNVTPDSFYSGSRVTTEQALIGRVQQMVDDGVTIIDVGACSTRPGSESVDALGEMERLRWALGIIRRQWRDVLISVDTFRADVAQRCVEQWGADIINDISGGTLDKDMFATMARLQVPYVLMHMRGNPETMSSLTDYDNVTTDVLEWMARRVDELRQTGVEDIIADPGFGFAKTLEQNYQLLAQLSAFHTLEIPLLVGISRKRMIYSPLGCSADQALNGTSVLNTWALTQGAHILRVHDVKAAVEAVTLTTALRHAATQ